ncbi:MAG: phage major capsid domain-containing protein, partial [Dolichospermum sp.]
MKAQLTPDNTVGSTTRSDTVKEVLWQSTVTLKISNPNKSPYDFAINYGVTDALAPFPLHSLVSVMSCTI